MWILLLEKNQINKGSGKIVLLHKLKAQRGMFFANNQLNLTMRKKVKIICHTKKYNQNI